jgi:hypothetical protein
MNDILLILASLLAGILVEGETHIYGTLIKTRKDMKKALEKTSDTMENQTDEIQKSMPEAIK